MSATRIGILVSLCLAACNVGTSDGATSLSGGFSAGEDNGDGSATTAGNDDSDEPTQGPTAQTGGGTDEPTPTSAADDTDGADATATATATDGNDDEGMTTDSGTDPGSTGDDPPGSPLDPGLDTPDEGEACMTPGSLGECPALQVCRFHTTEQGRCESCDTCGNLGAPCVEGTDCDILFACYQGQCTNICELGTFFCGPIEDCLNVGHPTHGVCAPF
ncbi:MAG: hypothetical protein AAF799_34435 [Myxococcota bacterium]